MTTAAESIVAAIDAIAERISQHRCTEPATLQRIADENAARRASPMLLGLERVDRIAVTASMRRLDRVLAARLGQP